MTLLIVLALVSALAFFAAVVFAAVVVGIHSEPRREMTTRAHGLLAAMARRMLGVYVGKPADADTDDREKCLTGNATKGGGDR